MQLFNNFTYVICGDGCLMEGVSAEACSLAGRLTVQCFENVRCMGVLVETLFIVVLDIGGDLVLEAVRLLQDI